MTTTSPNCYYVGDEVEVNFYAFMEEYRDDELLWIPGRIVRFEWLKNGYQPVIVEFENDLGVICEADVAYFSIRRKS